MPAINLRNVDLNLLLPLQALLEERSVTRAAKRVYLSQSAMSRVLERLRDQLGDPLLIRSGGKYQLTSRAVELMRELDLLVPRLQEVWNGSRFRPIEAEGTIRLAMTDNAATLLLPALTARLCGNAPRIKLEIVTLQEQSYEDLASGRVDIVFSPLAPLPPLVGEVLFKESFVCLVSQSHSFTAERFSMEQYLDYKHINIETQHGQLTFVDRPLAEAGLRRSIAIQLPYFIPAVLALGETELVVTLPASLGNRLLRLLPLRKVEVPNEITAFNYLMVWHPRLNDDALHAWFRKMVRELPFPS